MSLSSNTEKILEKLMYECIKDCIPFSVRIILFITLTVWI